MSLCTKLIIKEGCGNIISDTQHNMHTKACHDNQHHSLYIVNQNNHGGKKTGVSLARGLLHPYAGYKREGPKMNPQ